MPEFLKKFFVSVKALFVKADKALSQVEDLLPTALQVVELVASLTPARTDNEIASLIKTYALDLPPYGNKDNLLRAAARVLLQKRVRLSIKDSVANAAVELAVVVLKSRVSV